MDENLWFISFLSLTFAEMDFRNLISDLHCPLQFKLDDVSYRYWQKNRCEEVMPIYDIGIMTTVEFWECRSSLGMYLHLLRSDEQFFILFYYDRFSAVEKICAELAMPSARPLRRPPNSLIWHPNIEDMWCESPKRLTGYRLSPCHQVHGLNFAV
jgi:hypothetical protein